MEQQETWLSLRVAVIGAIAGPLGLGAIAAVAGFVAGLGVT